MNLVTEFVTGWAEWIAAIFALTLFLVGLVILTVGFAGAWAIGLFVRTRRAIGALTAIAAASGAGRKVKAAAAFAATTAMGTAKGGKA